MSVSKQPVMLLTALADFYFNKTIGELTIQEKEQIKPLIGLNREKTIKEMIEIGYSISG